MHKMARGPMRQQAQLNASCSAPCSIKTCPRNSEMLGLQAVRILSCLLCWKRHSVTTHASTARSRKRCCAWRHVLQLLGPRASVFCVCCPGTWPNVRVEESPSHKGRRVCTILHDHVHVCCAGRWCASLPFTCLNCTDASMPQHDGKLHSS